MLRYFVALAAALLLNAMANLLIKASALSPQAGGVIGAAKALATNWLFLLGLICFGLNLVAYQYALQRLQISIAYPIMVTCGYAIIVFVASTRMGERLAPVQWVGVALILVGVLLVSAYVKPEPKKGMPTFPVGTTNHSPPASDPAWPS